MDGGDLYQKFHCLRSLLEKMGSVLVAYSGGVDSTFLLKVAHEVLREKAVAVTACSETYPARELEEAMTMAREIGVRHLTIISEELDIPGFSQNPPDRCYFCKTELFSKLQKLAKEEGLQWIVDGTNLDDMGDHRPGRKAAQEMGIRSPLLESGLRKEEIRALSRELGLPTWEKPSMACLSSRFPYGTPITRERLRMVNAAEEYLHGLGFRQVRVRHHGEIARIEVEKGEIPHLLENAGVVAQHLKKVGYTYVTIDLEGYRSGSLNEVLKKAPGEEPGKG